MAIIKRRMIYPKTVYAVCKVLAEAQVRTNNFCIKRTRFYKKKNLYKDAAVDIFSSMLEIDKLAKLYLS